MRILHITAQKPDSTGSGVYLAETVRALDRAGHEQAVVCGIAPGDPVDLPQGVRVRPVVFDTPWGPSTWWACPTACPTRRPVTATSRPK